MKKYPLAALSVLIFFVAGLPSIGAAQSVRVTPIKGDLKIIEKGKETVVKSEIPLPDGAVIVCQECLVKGPGYQFIARDAKFSLTQNKPVKGRDMDGAASGLATVTVDSGNYTVTLAANTKFTVIGANGQPVTFTTGDQASTFTYSASGQIAVTSGRVTVANGVTKEVTLTVASGTVEAATLAPIAAVGGIPASAFMTGVAAAEGVGAGLSAATRGGNQLPPASP